jgi:serine/threonine protein kinase/tetratricopeptide (TPR) repeat protein
MKFEQSPRDNALSPTQFIEINRICDRFEAAWRAGPRPAIEEFLGVAGEPVRSELLRELLATEIERRRLAGEHPRLAEYHARFPDQSALVEAAFGAAGSPKHAQAAAPVHDGSATGRNLLFGLLALQNNFIDRDALVAAFGTWVTDKAKPLGAVLLARGALDGSRHSLLEALVAEHLKLHGGDPEQSLAALAIGGSTRESLQGVGDPGLDASLSHAGAATVTTGADPVSSYSTETSSAEGRRFRVLRPHAKGGLGAVFVALDCELNREVALKQILDRHADDPVNRARFLLEAEITGRLEHPGIVPVYGLGTYADGRPYYAMRFVRGDSLKEAIAAFHADATLNADPGRRSLELRKLLRRFLDVCNAIDYAHSRGVLHRDVKPGNVIVGKYGETLVVDWGLAKPMGYREPGLLSDERTLRPSSASGSAETLPGATLGTPAYMSPEQAAGELDRLGPRSDVYSLGATLYSLLTGRSPFGGTVVDEILRMVAKGMFPPPRRLDPSVDQALEAVCLKAMALSPEDRYATPRELADDIERWIADEPVTAWREPLLLRARRWGRRNRTTVASGAVALVTAVVGLTALAAMQNQANQDLRSANNATTKARIAAEQALDRERDAKKATDAALAQSEEARRRAQAVLRFLKEDVLAAARPEGEAGGLGIDATVRQAIDAAEPKIAAAFKDQPKLEAEIRSTLGETYYYLGVNRPAIEQLERATRLFRAELGSDHLDTLNSQIYLGDAHLAAGHITEVIKLHEETLKLGNSRLGLDLPDKLGSQSSLAHAYLAAGRVTEAIKLLQETLKRRELKLGPDDPATLAARNNLGDAYFTAGRISEAIKFDQATLELQEKRVGPIHPETLATRNNLGNAYLAAGRTAEALKLHQATVQLVESHLGPMHPDTLTSRNNLAGIYLAAGRTAESIKLHEETLHAQESTLGPDHPSTLTSRNNLATTYNRAGRTAEAIRLHLDTIKLLESKFGPNHPATLRTRNNLGVAYMAAGRTADALELFEETFRKRRSVLGPDHPDTMVNRINLGAAYNRIGRASEAIPLLQEAVTFLDSNVGPDHPDTLRARDEFAEAYFSVGRTAEAIKLFETLLRQKERIFGPETGYTLKTQSRLILAYESAGRWADAEVLRRVNLALRRNSTKPSSTALANDIALLAMNLLKQSKWAEAEILLRECLAIRETAIPDDWSKFNTMSQLGEALIDQAKFAAAEPLVVGGYEGMKARAKAIPSLGSPRLAEAGGRVVGLYERWGKPGKAAEWKVKLGLSDLPTQVFAPR